MQCAGLLTASPKNRLTEGRRPADKGLQGKKQKRKAGQARPVGKTEHKGPQAKSRQNQNPTAGGRKAPNRTQGPGDKAKQQQTTPQQGQGKGGQAVWCTGHKQQKVYCNKRAGGAKEAHSTLGYRCGARLLCHSDIGAGDLRESALIRIGLSAGHTEIYNYTAYIPIYDHYKVIEHVKHESS